MLAPNTFKESIIATSWYHPGVKLLCACSGGIDSTVLLDLLVQVPNIELSIVHFNHQLRGEESNVDQDFVTRLAEQYQLDIFTVSEDIASYAKERHLSIEEAGSRRRRKRFSAILQDINYDYIVTGQHLDDQIETILMNLYHGSGVRGLAGIAASQNRFLRPLIQVTRQQIADYSAQHKLEFREDKSNTDLKYLRNNIRANLMPDLKSAPGFTTEGLFQKLTEQAAVLVKRLSGSTEHTVFIEDGMSFVVKIPLGMRKLSDYFSPIQKVIFDSAFHAISSMPQGLSSRHFDFLKSLVKSTAIGKEIHLPDSVTALRNRNDIVLFHEADFFWESTLMCDIGKAIFPFFKFNYFAEKIDSHLRDGHYFWYSHPTDQYCLRNNRDGDTIAIDDSGKRVSVKRILQEAHIAQYLKPYFPVLEYEGEILWIPGLRTSVLAMIQISTIKEKEVRHCIRVEFQEGTFE